MVIDMRVTVLKMNTLTSKFNQIDMLLLVVIVCNWNGNILSSLTNMNNVKYDEKHPTTHLKRFQKGRQWQL